MQLLLSPVVLEVFIRVVLHVEVQQDLLITLIVLVTLLSAIDLEFINELFVVEQTTVVQQDSVQVQTLGGGKT